MNIKLLPYTGNKTLAIGDATAMAIAPADRALKPYPPGKVQVNGDYWPDGGTYVGDATLTWAHRNRWAQQQRNVVHQDAASVAAGPEGTYTVEVLIAGTVIAGRTTTGITGTSFAYTLAQRAEDDADMSKQVRFRITPVSGALSGTARLTDPFVMQA